MKQRKMTRLAVALAVFGLSFGLMGCGNDQSAKRASATIKDLSSMAVEKLGGKGEATPPVDPRVSIETTMREIPGVPLQFVMQEKTSAYAVTSIYGQNGSVVTWVGADRKTTSLDGGLLTATRGFGNDLMSVEDGGAVRLITTKQAGTVTKTYRFLDGLERTTRLTLTCAITPGETQSVTSGEISTSARIVRETCQTATGGFSFTNTYWIDAGGRTVQSVQWASAEIGQLVFRRLR
ncbi:MAG: YjbF family lipoprotein [Alphaproteobacteria bacterium]|nr:YjbF family lipoprotein [Alphaproteobacteria bacterium]MBU1572946.1 YjbF family lipoprotein [Alphaproteobacteria bacterium]MBU2077846.1 YjbF family lipoprotein [Alphaproteobacteria bacterium]MBU2242729.1 YjbF family lipoprotein [Alphaproteobacteria bacterium]